MQVCHGKAAPLRRVKPGDRVVYYSPTLEFRSKSKLQAFTVKMKAAPTARDLLVAIEVLKEMNERQSRKIPDDAPTSFVRKRWETLVSTPEGLDRRSYELCVLSQLKNSPRSGDIWCHRPNVQRRTARWAIPAWRAKTG